MSKCYRCNGKGGMQQVTGYFPDGEPDVNWDVCPECDGKGKVEEPKYENE
ncbi:hypothetical protein [Bacillus sp. MMSF_3328]|nr:hypothetical protein [Bacillus sp. MMSF_3328]